MEQGEFAREQRGAGAAAPEGGGDLRKRLIFGREAVSRGEMPRGVLGEGGAALRREDGKLGSDDRRGALVGGDEFEEFIPWKRGCHGWVLWCREVRGLARKEIARAGCSAWAAARPHTVVAPLAAWTRPLVTGDDVELAPGERVPAASLMFLDGLHANALGTWHLLDLLDHLLERELAIAPDVFRPARPPG